MRRKKTNATTISSSSRTVRASLSSMRFLTLPAAS
jgi:hypothetical protein